MLTATEFYPLTTALTIVLWVEAIVYLAVGVTEIFDDFHRKTPPWAYINGRLNALVWYLYKKGHKMHASIALLLGLIALNGLVEGQVSRFEIELIFLSLALLVCSIFCMAPPNKRLTFGILPFAPEFWLQIAMFALFTDLVRPEVIVLCVLLNLWGFFVFFRKTSRMEELPHSYEPLRIDMIEAGVSEPTIKFYDRLAGHIASPAYNPPTSPD